MNSVNISLDLGDDVGPTPFLSIPKEDIKRLSLSPHKWLRFVLFTICGAHGVLSVTPQGPPVKDDARFADIGESYYYTLRDTPPHFVDYQAFNGKITSTEKTPRTTSFCECVMRRDGSCVATGTNPDACDAAHIISRGKGDAYIQLIVESRRNLYSLPEVTISGIDDVQNGILLAKTLHSKFDHGNIAFLKTPNFVLSCDDIPRVGDIASQGLPSRITMQNLVPDLSRSPVLNLDAYFTGAEDLPPAIILDYMYGAAAYQCWRSNQHIHEQLQSYFMDHYQQVLTRTPFKAPTNYCESGSDDDDDDYTLTTPGMIDAVDEMNLVLMMLSGTTLEEWAAKCQEQQDEEKLRERDASRMKVLEWKECIADTAPEESKIGVKNT